MAHREVGEGERDDQARHRARDVGAPLEQAREPCRVAHGEHCDGDRRDRREQRGGEAEADRRQGRARDRGRGQRGGGADDQPVAERSHRHADCEGREPAERAERGDRPQPESRAAAPRRRLRSRRRASLEAGLRAQQQQAEADEHEREHRGGRRIEAELVLGVDLGRERAEAEQRERAVLGQQVQRDDQAAAEQRQPQLGQRHAPEDRERTEALAARHVLERRVGAPQRGDGRQHHERVVGEHAHEHRAPEALDAVVEADPGEAVDELRHGQGQRQQHRPEAAARQIGAFQQPGDAGADDCAERGREQHELERVAQELVDVGQAQQVQRSRPAGAGGLHPDERERQQQHAADGQREQPERRGTEPTPP